MSEASSIVYRVCPTRPESHQFDVELLIPASEATTLTLSMPAWIPGSYMIRDFARNVVALDATPDATQDATGAAGPLAVTKLDKQTWRLDGVDGDVVVRYQVHAFELTVRSAYLDSTQGYFNGPSLLLRVHGLDHRPCRLELLPPDGDAYAHWRVATSLRRADARPWGFGGYLADDYDDLIDHPVQMGQFDLLEFQVRGVPHWMAISGRHDADLSRLASDLPPICEQHAALFGELPVDRYLFLTMVVADGYGGLEHRFSTSLLCSRGDLPQPPHGADASGPTQAHASGGYRRFLGLCSHEYFHLWNVKRIRPAVFAANGLDREVHTRLLWAFEGITSYYDDMALVRSGRIDAKGYLEMLAETVTRVMRNPGRLRQTLAESSFDAWTKFYKQDANAPNAIVSYYGKGAIAALALDLTIRQGTGGERSLDDVMRALWQRYGQGGDGVPERGVEALAAEVSGLELDGFFEHALDSTDDLDLARLLAGVGVEMRLRPSRGDKDTGNVSETFEPVEPDADIGVRFQPGSSEAQVAVVIDDRPARRAGIAPGDVLVAIDGLRASAANADEMLRRAVIGRPLTVHAFRRDELMTFEVTPAPAPADTCELCLSADAPVEILARRAAWLGSSGLGASGLGGSAQ
jgi:predicted metalloprotease with PDZ domain